MPGFDSKTPTLDDVAAAAGVSRMTVSRALNGTGPVASSTKARILEAGRRLGYPVDGKGRRTRPRQVSGNILVLRYLCLPTPDLYFEAVLKGIERGFALSGCRVIPRILSATHLNGITEWAADSLAGVIVVGPGLSPQFLYECDVPLVTVAWHTPLLRASTVLADNIGGTWAALDHLFSRGRDQVALITGPTDHPEVHERIVAFHAYHSMKGKPLRRDWIYTSDYTHEANEKALDALFSMKERPNAVFCTSGAIAASAVHALKAHGLSGKGDVAILSFDDDDDETMPSWVSKVQVDRERMGVIAAELLLFATKSNLVDETRVVVPVRLVPGGW